MEDKVKWLELELEKTKRSGNESTEQFQTKVNLKSSFSAVTHFSHLTTDNWFTLKTFLLLEHSDGFNPAWYFVLTLAL